MTIELLIIAMTRLLGALPVLRWPFYGGLLALVIDQSDLLLMNLIHLGGIGDYQTFDKVLDQAYLLTFLIVALRWRGLPRSVAVGLFVFRFVGFVAFETFEERWILLVFPNLFESWFLVMAGRVQFNLEARLAGLPLAALLLAMLALKMFQEYALHHARWLDSFTTTEAIEAAWRLIIPF